MIGQDSKGKSITVDWIVVDMKGRHNPVDHVAFYCDPKRPSRHMPEFGGREQMKYMLAQGENPKEMPKISWSPG